MLKTWTGIVFGGKTFRVVCCACANSVAAIM